MANILTKIGSADNVAIHKYQADTEEDMYAINLLGVPMGSKCYIINTGKWYMLNSEGQWKIMPSNGSTTSELAVDYIFEQNKKNKQKVWNGTKAEFNTLSVKDENMLYLVEEDGEPEHILKELYIKVPPATTDYFIGDAFDPVGMVVVAKYADNSEKEVINYTLETSDLSALGTRKIKISFEEDGVRQTVEQSVDVNPKGSIVFLSDSEFTISSELSSLIHREYSFDNDVWKEWDGTALTGTMIYMRGTQNSPVTEGGSDGKYYGQLVIEGHDVGCYGDLGMLMDYQTYDKEKNHIYGPAAFSGCSALIHAPILSSLQSENDCYKLMFANCSLTAAPKLPATTLKPRCYLSMFSGCTSLTTAPELPATTLVDSCYNSMFYGCTSLTTAPELPATTVSYASYTHMFDGCTSLVTPPELPATIIGYNCYRNMFSGCTSLSSVPDLPALEPKTDSYSEMFLNTNLRLYTTPAEGRVEFRYPKEGKGVNPNNGAANEMFSTSDGKTSTPAINTTYYLAYEPN